MGGLISAMISGMVKNIEKDYVDHQDEFKNPLIAKQVEQENIIFEIDEENIEMASFPTLLHAIPPLHYDGYLNTQNKTNQGTGKL